MSAVAADGLQIGALVAVNSWGEVVMPGSGCFWAWPLEQDGEFGGHEPPRAGTTLDPALPPDPLSGQPGANTTIGIVATNAVLSKAEAHRVAIMAQDGFARAIRPAHTPFDGDTIFVLATGDYVLPEPRARALARIGAISADCVARAVARGVYAAAGLGDRPSWQAEHGGKRANKGPGVTAGAPSRPADISETAGAAGRSPSREVASNASDAGSGTGSKPRDASTSNSGALDDRQRSHLAGAADGVLHEGTRCLRRRAAVAVDPVVAVGGAVAPGIVVLVELRDIGCAAVIREADAGIGGSGDVPGGRPAAIAKVILRLELARNRPVVGEIGERRADPERLVELVRRDILEVEGAGGRNAVVLVCLVLIEGDRAVESRFTLNCVTWAWVMPSARASAVRTSTCPLPIGSAPGKLAAAAAT